MSFKKKSLFGTSMLAGVAALAVSSGAAAQQTATPGSPIPADQPTTAQPNPADQASGAAEDATTAGVDAAGQDTTEVDAVIVTGSRIRRDPTNAPAPLIVLGREEVLQSGEANVVDFLADIPALQNSQVPEDTTGSVLNIAGLSLLDLRALGTARTLVLVDGRRHVGAVQGGLQVDVDTIPRLLVQSTEIVTGGQSALYGADAVAGVVNFILRRNFEGIEVDATVGERVQEGPLSRRISALIGHNFLDDRLNVYAHLEYQNDDNVAENDLDWRRDNWLLVDRDVDPSATQPDGEIDNILIRDARDLARAVGGTLVLANQLVPPPASDPDIAGVTNCTAPNAAATTGTAFAAGCFTAEPGYTFVFDPGGVGRLANFGTYRREANTAGAGRTVNVGGDGRLRNTEWTQYDRLPRGTATRFQTGFNFNVTEDIQLFGEYKYVIEDQYFEGQGNFADIGISTVAAGQQPDVFNVNSAPGNIGLDNAYLPANVRAAILANTRRTSQTNAAVISDQRARISIFSDEFFGRRSQDNERETTRYVLGLRGDRDELFFVRNFAWELGYTHGEAENINRETGMDAQRLIYAADAVVDTAGLVNGTPGQIVCRIQLLQAQGTPALDPLSNYNANAAATQNLNRTALIVSGVNYGADTPFAANDPDVTGCRPLNLFGGPNYQQEAANYINTTIRTTHVNEQDNFVAFASGEFWDFWGAGGIGLAVGYEYREEFTEGQGRSTDVGPRVLQLNSGADFTAASYDVTEWFTELRIPLLRDLPFAQSAEISGAFRRSDYSNIGAVDTYSFQASWRPIEDLAFRGTYGRATRIPSLAETNAPFTQTFANNFVDPCDVNQINNVADPVIKANRIQNCAALGIPTGTAIVYPSGVPGRNGGNPFLEPEVSDSYTWSVILTPRFMPRFSLVFDVYDIKIEQAIAGITVATALTQCVNNASLNPNACATIFRNGPTQSGNTPPYGVFDFIQSSINYAQLRARGVDFTARYNFDLNDWTGLDWGRIDYALRGGYILRRENFTNIADPSASTDFDGATGVPRLRTLQTVTWTPQPGLSFTWDWDWISSQEILDEDVLVQDPDNRSTLYYTIPPFNQHDFSVRWEVRDNVTLRAGVTNAFDAEPVRWIHNAQLAAPNTDVVNGGTGDLVDLFGRRFFLGINYRR